MSRNRRDVIPSGIASPVNPSARQSTHRSNIDLEEVEVVNRSSILDKNIAKEESGGFNLDKGHFVVLTPDSSFDAGNMSRQ